MSNNLDIVYLHGDYIYLSLLTIEHFCTCVGNIFIIKKHSDKINKSNLSEWAINKITYIDSTENHIIHDICNINNISNYFLLFVPDTYIGNTLAYNTANVIYGDILTPINEIIYDKSVILTKQLSNNTSQLYTLMFNKYPKIYNTCTPYILCIKYCKKTVDMFKDDINTINPYLMAQMMCIDDDKIKVCNTSNNIYYMVTDNELVNDDGNMYTKQLYSETPLYIHIKQSHANESFNFIYRYIKRILRTVHSNVIYTSDRNLDNISLNKLNVRGQICIDNNQMYKISIGDNKYVYKKSSSLIIPNKNVYVSDKESFNYNKIKNNYHINILKCMLIKQINHTKYYLFENIESNIIDVINKYDVLLQILAGVYHLNNIVGIYHGNLVYSDGIPLINNIVYTNTHYTSSTICGTNVPKSKITAKIHDFSKSGKFDTQVHKLMYTHFPYSSISSELFLVVCSYVVTKAYVTHKISSDLLWHIDNVYKHMYDISNQIYNDIDNDKDKLIIKVASQL
jgi:hypothetical protein